MSAVSAPFGFLPVFHPSGIIRSSAYPGGVVSGYNTNIFKGTPVLWDTAGVLQAVTAANQDFAGIFMGCEFQQGGQLPPQTLPYWPANQTYIAGSCVIYIWDDPDLWFLAQADGSVAQTAIADQVNISNFTAGSTATGLSAATVSATPVGVGNQGQWSVMGLATNINNAWGDAFTVLQLKMARNQRIANKVAV